jgi:hypothetical protein
MMNTAQWDHAFADGAMFKHGNMGQGIYVDPARDFCGMYFGLASNDEKVAGNRPLAGLPASGGEGDCRQLDPGPMNAGARSSGAPVMRA